MRIQASDGMSGLSGFLMNDLGKSEQSLPRSFISQSRLVASGDLTAEERSRRIRVILLHPFPLRLWGRPLSELASTTKGLFGCFGIGRISRIASEHPNAIAQ